MPVSPNRGGSPHCDSLWMRCGASVDARARTGGLRPESAGHRVERGVVRAPRRRPAAAHRAGLSYRAISELVSTDISADGDDSLWIAGGHRLRIDAGTVPGFAPAQVWGRWNEVLVFADRYPSTTLILGHLRAGTFADMTARPLQGSPVAVPIDRWGHMPYPADAMTPDTIGDVVEAHRTGTPPRRTPARTRPRNRSAYVDGNAAEPTALEPDSISLESGYHAAGVQARRRAHTVLAELPQVYDEVEDRIDALLARTLDLLEYHSTDPEQQLR